jgi:hypothetical protein
LWELAFDEHGRTISPSAGTIASAIHEGGVTDLFVFVHGWNVDRADARAMFHRFSDSIGSVAQMSWIRSARPGVLGVIWSSIARPGRR